MPRASCAGVTCRRSASIPALTVSFARSNRCRPTNTMADDSSPQLTLPVGPRDHTDGPANARITLVEYGDYECPHCGRAYPIVKEIQRRMASRLRFVFRNFPLVESHPH